jgi:gluconate 5-dehydrogenase
MNKFRLDGKRGLVTGGSRGIGFGIAKALAEAGADIALVARSEDQLREARERLEATGRRIWLFPFDMGQVDGIDELYARITAETGGIDILINNAGGTRRGPAESMSSEDWDFVINLNLTSVFTLCRAFARQRIESGNPGKIVNIASLMSESVREQNAPYAASKGGIRQLTKALAVDWARYGINVNAIGPGYIRTELTQSLWTDDKFDQWVRERTPAGRWGSPEDLAYAALFLVSPASDFITGHILYVDGGFLSRF